MSEEASNVALLKDAYEKWKSSKGAREHFLNLADPAIRFGSLARGEEPLSFACAYNGRQALSDYFDGLAANWEMVESDAEDFVAQGEMVVMRGSCAWKNKHTGRVMETPKLDIWRMRDGKAVEFYEFYDTLAAYKAASP